ncbi:MAG: UDP-2,3-diacylglucosamine diphosphatase LpxI [Rhodobacteraceae bacterium]|nr:UDP-2,3-diacylglucosamine diphosphatase LpxI [Paracoccaceae bacterium]
MLALIAGQGRLPAVLAAAQAGAQGDRPLVCALEGFAPEGLAVDIRFRLETLGTLIGDLRARGVRRVCMAGAVRRMTIDPGLIDAATRPLVPILQRAQAGGDDAALRAVIAVFEQAGLHIVAAHEVAPDLLPPPGCATRAQPDEGARADAVRAQAIVAAMGRADTGQSCAVLKGQALAIEGVFGTDWMLSSLRARPDSGGGILYKAPKPAQDRRADLPAIGPETVPGAQAAGLGGIVIEAGGVIVLDRAQVLEDCDRRGLFLWVREPSG